MYFNDYSDYDSELTAEKFLGLERDKHHEEGQSHDDKPVHDSQKEKHVTEVKDNHKRDYHEMIDGLIKDWYDPARYLETGGYLSPESNDVGKEFLELEESNEQNPDNSTSVFDKIKKTLKKVFKTNGNGIDGNEETLVNGFDSDVSLIDSGVEAQIDGLRFANSTNGSTNTTMMPLVTTTLKVNTTVVGAKNESESLESYPKILRQFSERDMEFLKRFLSCLKKSVNITSLLPAPTHLPKNTTTVASVSSTTTKDGIKLTNDSVLGIRNDVNSNVTKVGTSRKSTNDTHFILKCIPMPSPVASEMISFNCKFSSDSYLSVKHHYLRN